MSNDMLVYEEESILVAVFARNSTAHICEKSVATNECGLGDVGQLSTSVSGDSFTVEHCFRGDTRKKRAAQTRANDRLGEARDWRCRQDTTDEERNSHLLRVVTMSLRIWGYTRVSSLTRHVKRV